MYTIRYLVAAAALIGISQLGLSGASAVTQSAEVAGDERPATEEAFTNFDFVPGERVLFVEDFEKDIVGDFPRRLELVSGNGEVAELKGRRWLRIPSDLTIAIPFQEILPQRFTFEFDLYAPGVAEGSIYFTDAGHDGYENGGKARANFVKDEESSYGGINELSSERSAIGKPKQSLPNTFPVRLMVDGKYVKMYVAGTRVANAPNFDLGRGRKIIMHFPDNSSGFEGAFISNIRVAAGGRDMYEALKADGRVSLQGIFFDTGSDRIRPESAQTLTQIGDMLRRFTDLRLKVEGHTDNVGDDAANKLLSQRRATAVKAYLISNMSVGAERLEAVGIGEERPTSSNNTPEGRQQNRRVDLVRL